MSYLVRFVAPFVAAKKSLLRTGAIALLGVGIVAQAGCGSDISAKVSCASASDCGHPDDLATPQCCAQFCVAASSGCDSGYRYITSAPEFGECVVDPMCPAPPADMTAVPPDMSMPIDMSGDGA